MMPLLVVFLAAVAGYVAGLGLQTRLEDSDSPLLKVVFHPLATAVVCTVAVMAAMTATTGRNAPEATRPPGESQAARSRPSPDVAPAREPRSVKTLRTMADLEQFVTAAGSEPVLIDFFATWCAPCKMVAPEVEALAREGYWVAKVDVDVSRELAQQFQVSAIPTIVVIRDGQVRVNTTGARTRAGLKKLIES